MNLIAELDNEKHKISFKIDGENVLAEVDGREYRLQADEIEPNVYLFKLNNQVFQIHCEANGVVNLKDNQFSVKIINPKHLRAMNADVSSADGLAEIKTAMPGKIIKYLVEENSEVKIGDGIVIVEAMKMQNEMKSPKDGIVKTLRFNSGDTVNAGDILAIVE